MKFKVGDFAYYKHGRNITVVKIVGISEKGYSKGYNGKYYQVIVWSDNSEYYRSGETLKPQESSRFDNKYIKYSPSPLELLL